MPRNATIVVVTLALLTGGCAVHPNVLAETELRSRMSQDLTDITANNLVVRTDCDRLAVWVEVDPDENTDLSGQEIE